MLGRFPRGRTVHAVHFRPDLPDRWRAECGRARSSNPPRWVEGVNDPPGDDVPACEHCIRSLRQRLDELEARQ